MSHISFLGCDMARWTKTPLERLLDKIVKAENGCWIWTAAKNPAGYGVMVYKKNLRLATRISWMEHVGEIPEGMNVCHRCDDPACINPEHLFLGTQRENMHDMIGKGRQYHPSGEDTHNCRLSWDKVRHIRSSGLPGTELARLYGVKKNTIYSVLKNRTWKE